MKYVLLFVGTEEFSENLEPMGEAERERAFQRVHEWMAEHAGRIRGRSKLQSPDTARSWPRGFRRTGPRPSTPPRHSGATRRLRAGRSKRSTDCGTVR